MCCNSKSTSESGVGFSPTDEAVCLLVENASLGPNAHTARTESNFSLVTKTEERCKSTYRKTQSMAPLPATPRLDCDIERDWSPNEAQRRERKMRESTQLSALLPFQFTRLLTFNEGIARGRVAGPLEQNHALNCQFFSHVLCCFCLPCSLARLIFPPPPLVNQWCNRNTAPRQPQP